MCQRTHSISPGLAQSSKQADTIGTNHSAADQGQKIEIVPKTPALVIIT
jgi:hypothetical protein